MKRNFNTRLVKIENVTQPADPPTIQVVFHRWDDTVEYGKVQAAPHGQWKGLKTVNVRYAHEWPPGSGAI